MLNHTETRLRALCEQAIGAREASEVERLLTEFRLALEDHIAEARISLGSQLYILREFSPEELSETKKR
jgi:hypothetical protein